jgi:hypothetical protein
LSFCPLISSGLCTHTFKAPGAKSNTHLTAQTHTHRFLSQHPRKLKTCAASVCVFVWVCVRVCVCVCVCCTVRLKVGQGRVAQVGRAAKRNRIL